VARHVKVPLGTLACNGIEAHLGADIRAAVRAALADFTQRLEPGRAPFDLPRASVAPVSTEPATVLDLSVDERTWQLLQREARRQNTTVARLAAHSVLVHLAELERLKPPSSARA
jgi:hypothetical protein